MSFLVLSVVAAKPDMLLSKQVSLQGTVISLDSEKRIMRLAHASAGSILPEGEHAFSVGRGDVVIYQKGDVIRGEVFAYEDGFRLEKIWPLDPLEERTLQEINRRLRQETVTRGKKVFRAVGEQVPDFALYNERGKLVQPRMFRGQAIVLNFIFTRCDQPAMCPAATRRMVRLQEELQEAGIKNVQLLSISFDPQYDTPGILNQYASDRNIDTGNFSLLTGPERAIDDLLLQFGIFLKPETGTLNHTMATLLIDPHGKIVYRKDGSRWSVKDFLDRLARI